METYGLEKLGIINAGAVYRNLTPAQLVEHALRRGEGTLSNTGALVVKTGKYTGRSANDKFIVDTPAVHDDIAWGKVNRPMDKARFDAIYAKVTAYLQNKDVFIFDGFAGADPSIPRPSASSTSWPARICSSTSCCAAPRRTSWRASMRITPSSPPPASSAFPRWTAPAPRLPFWWTMRPIWW